MEVVIAESCCSQDSALSSAGCAHVPQNPHNPDPTTTAHTAHTPWLNAVQWHFWSALSSKPEHPEELMIEKLISQKPLRVGFTSCITSKKQGIHEEWCLYNELFDCKWRKVALLLTFCNLSIMSSMLTSAVCNTLLSICTSQEHSSLFFSLNTIQALSLSSISCFRRDTYGRAHTINSSNNFFRRKPAIMSLLISSLHLILFHFAGIVIKYSTFLSKASKQIVITSYFG